MAVKPHELIQRLYMKEQKRGFPLTFLHCKKKGMSFQAELWFILYRDTKVETSLKGRLLRYMAFMSEVSIYMQFRTVKLVF